MYLSWTTPEKDLKMFLFYFAVWKVVRFYFEIHALILQQETGAKPLKGLLVTFVLGYGK